ncbi:hypothetical protein D3C81_816350 [compost metagenome]
MMTAIGTMIVGTIAEATGDAINGAGNKPAARLSADAIGNAGVIGSAAMNGPCITVTRTITVTIAVNG